MKWPQEPRMPGLTHFFSRQTPVGSACARLWQGFCGEPDRCGHVLGECLGVGRCKVVISRPGPRSREPRPDSVWGGCEEAAAGAGPEQEDGLASVLPVPGSPPGMGKQWGGGWGG